MCGLIISDAKLLKLLEENPGIAVLYRQKIALLRDRMTQLTAKEKECYINFFQENKEILEIVDEPYEPKK
jgi:hypothetical protein